MEITPEHIPDEDSLFRAVIFPLAFNKAKQVAHNRMLALHPESDGSLITSLAWRRYVPSTEQIHGYGCRVAHCMNLKKKAEVTEFKEEHRRVYSGSYHLKATAVRALVTTVGSREISSADIIHDMEGGEKAHASLRIAPREGHSISDGTKTVILDRLWNTCSGPLRHTCDCDHDVNPHPSKSLPIPPSGPYIDPHSDILP